MSEGVDGGALCSAGASTLPRSAHTLIALMALLGALFLGPESRWVIPKLLLGAILENLLGQMILYVRLITHRFVIGGP